jgi:thiamine pyrophosphokinase
MSAVFPASDDLDAVTVVLTGGVGPTGAQYDALVGSVRRPVKVVAADSGADHARALGVRVDVAVGDFDSASDATLLWLSQQGSEVREFGPHKDQSDLELALEAASEDDPEVIFVLGLGGGRPDHSLLNLVVLADPRWSTARVFGLADDCWISVVRDQAEIRGELGSLVSLVPIGGPASASTAGLLFCLDAEELSPTRARGLSNVLAARSATVRVEAGVLLVMQPLDEGTERV